MKVLTRSEVLAAVVFLAWGVSATDAQDLAPLAEAEPIAEAEAIAEAEPIAEAVAEPVARAEKPAARGNAVPGGAVALSTTLQLNVGNSELRGALLSAPQFTMKTSFGELVIPMTQVAGIKLASEDNASTTVVMHNGDSITGGWDLDRIELQTEWGTATIDGSAINSILFTPDMAWVSEKGLSGTRWALMTRPEARASATPFADLQPGDIIIVATDSELKSGTEVVGRVSRDDVLVIEGVLDSYFYVNNGDAAGWIAKEDVSPYREPEPSTTEPESDDVVETRRTSRR